METDYGLEGRSAGGLFGGIADIPGLLPLAESSPGISRLQDVYFTLSKVMAAASSAGLSK